MLFAEWPVAVFILPYRGHDAPAGRTPSGCPGGVMSVRRYREVPWQAEAFEPGSKFPFLLRGVRRIVPVRVVRVIVYLISAYGISTLYLFFLTCYKI